ncbi:MAG: 23S rRNA (guanosine2251-2'-O)-methyltransferase [Patiriisocius sp.]|jgi:23S rRNA (guanosine2251-2'-O)-methyltransferase
MKLLILDNIRSAHNVGSIFRSADGAGAQKIYLVGPTPTPIDRFGRPQPEIVKTSLGASESMSWEHIGDSASESVEETLACIATLKAEGYTIVAVEQSEKSISLDDFTVPEKVVYILGAEVEGVHQEVMDAADVIVEIPMAGMKESLNVSVTAGIILFSK